MRAMAKVLEAEGYTTWSLTYPSRTRSIVDLADWVGDRIEENHAGPLRAVTHSLGGIIVRFLADRFEWKSTVMLAPPNQGSLIARRLRGTAPYKWYYGPAGLDVAEADGWPGLPTPCGVIAGTKRMAVENPTSWVSSMGLLPPEEPGDGTVLVSEADHPDATDFATVHSSHTWIMNNTDAQALVCRFLQAGTF